MPAIRDFSQGYHATTTYRHVEAPMPAQEAGDLLLAFITIDDSAGTSAQTCVGGMPVPYVFYDDSGTFTDYTVQANDATAGDWYMTPTTPTATDTDHIYFGSTEKFTQVNVLNSVAGAATTNTVWALQYYDSGTGWTTLTTTTNTFGANMEFVTTVHAEAIWTPPANWTTFTINSVTAYWVRWVCTTSNTFQTRPVSSQAWIVPVLNSNNGWRQLFAYYAGTTPSPLSVMWKIANADELDVTFFYATAETADVELIAIRDVEASVDSGVAALTVNIVAAAGTFIRTAGSWVTDGFAAGMQIQPSGFTNAANNYIRQIGSITTTTNPNDTITVTSTTGLVNESGNANERIIAWPFSSNISGGGTGSTFDGYTTSNAALYRNAMPQVTTTKNDCLIIWATNRDAVAVPSIIEGPCQLIAGKDGTAHADGMAWGYQMTAGATAADVYSTAMSALVSEMAVVAVNPPYSGATLRPAYTLSDASVYISPFTGAAFGSDSVPANTITTPFTGRINGKPLAAGGTTVTRADTGINSYHAMSQFTGLATNGTWAGTRTTIASRSIAGKNILFHIQPYLPVDIQTTDSVSLNGVCGVAIGLATAAGVYKVWHVNGAGVYGDTQRHQPVVINTSATAGLLSHAGSFAVSGGSGTFAATSRIYVGASWAAATKRAFITSVSGSSPNQTINYSTLSGYGYTTDFAASDAVVEYTVANANGATGTAGAVTSLNGAAVVEVGLMVSGKVVAPNWLAASVWSLDTYVIAGGIAAAPIDLPQIVKCYAAGHERRSAIQQGSKQALFLGPVQIGDGTNFTYLNLDGTAIEFPRQYNKDAKEVYYNSIDNVCGLKYKAAAGDTIIHKNSVISSASRFFWGLDSAFSTSVTPDFSGTSVIGSGTITLARAVTITGLTINDYSTLDVSGLTFTAGTIKNMPTTNDSITTSNATVISNSSINTTTVTAGNRWCSVAIGDLDIFSGNTFTGSSTTGHAIRISAGAGSNTISGNTFTSYGPAARSFNTSSSGIANSTDIITLDAAHGYSNGDPIYYQDQGGSQTVGLTDGNLYYARSETSNSISTYDTSAHAIAGGATGLTNLTAAGSETHYIYSAGAAIYNNSGGVITITITNGGSIPSIRNSDSSSTTIIANVNVTVTIKDQAGDPIPGVQVAIFQDNTARTVVLASTSTDENGEVTTVAAQSLGAIIIRARQSTAIATFNTTTGVNTGTEVITTEANHDFHNGDAVVYSRNGGTQDIGPEEGTYYVNSVSANTLMLYDTAANAIAGGATGKQDLTTAGGGETHLLNPVRYVAGSATGTIGTNDFSAQITMVTDSITSG